ncbi:MAG: sigma-54 dependent transcriptional regulator [Myxococcota bacterium]|nr:sigma-54 dependent transcriptional regulator [Myxococcota bacterium]
MSPRQTRILLVEDNDTLRRATARALAERFGPVDSEARGDDACARLRDAEVEPYDVVITDLRLPGTSGLDVVREARGRSERSAILLTTAFGSIETAVEAMRLGAFDFLQKPVELPELEVRVERALEHAKLVRRVATLEAERENHASGPTIIGESPAFRAAVDLATRVAATRSTVLVTGETGTGKELVASLVHAHSKRAEGPFVKVNCAALPETLLESELFGHERGAFTSADRQRIGRFEQADGGTLFMDEVGDMSPATQAKLLRVMQDQEFHRLGGTRPLRTDVRIVAATNRDLPAAIAEGAFREDLYFRLNVIGIQLPPLRERPEDLAALSQHFLAEIGRELGRPREGFAEEALAFIRSHTWPGNVRELRNVIERAVLLSGGPEVGVADLVLTGAHAERGWRPDLPAGGLPWDEIERAVLTEALSRTGWVQKDAAALLGMSRRRLNYVVRRLGITHSSWRRNRGEDP